MSVRNITKRKRPENAEELTRDLVQELRHPSTKGQPEIIIEQPQPGQPIHLYVIWDIWDKLSLQERSEIIMDAYEEAVGKQESSLITMAMGLTQPEAQRMFPSIVAQAN
jgi:hypothetical protein